MRWFYPPVRNITQEIFTATMLLAAGLLVGCATVPETGRRQLNLISAGEEVKLGLSAFGEVKKGTPISHDPAANAMLQRVGRRIAAVAQLPSAQWEFVLFESKEANAFCLPGGKVGVYTGLLSVAKDDAGLATVLGHEIAHAVARHGAERMSESLLMQVGGSALGAAVEDSDPRWKAAALTAYSVGAKYGRELPHSRGQESEADQIGLIYMARAGYDPEAAVGFWQRFAEYNRQHGGGQGLEFFRTHPLDETRIKQIQGWLPRAKSEYKPQ
ncbi:MAG TPA: M48 family metallopeptidase [Verrucomicrobiae bacterium]|jgi:predicted Zn-dependent protease